MAGDPVNVDTHAMPEAVACPVCAATHLSLAVTYTEPEDHEVEPGLTVRSPARIVGYHLEPCGHALADWKWNRTEDGTTAWTLTPMEVG